MLVTYTGFVPDVGAPFNPYPRPNDGKPRRMKDAYDKLRWHDHGHHLRIFFGWLMRQGLLRTEDFEPRARVSSPLPNFSSRNLMVCCVRKI